MKIAAAYSEGEIFQHFGHTGQFKLYTVENGKITSSKVVDTNGYGHGALALFLRNFGVDTLICGGIGAGAQQTLADAGIKLYGGVSGDADDAVQSILDGNLEYNPDVKCTHHEHEHSCHSRSCGEDKHGCSGNQGE